MAVKEGGVAESYCRGEVYFVSLGCSSCRWIFSRLGVRCGPTDNMQMTYIRRSCCVVAVWFSGVYSYRQKCYTQHQTKSIGLPWLHGGSSAAVSCFSFPRAIIKRLHRRALFSNTCCAFEHFLCPALFYQDHLSNIIQQVVLVHA